MTRRLAAVLCTLMVLVAACGSDDADDTSTDPTDGTETSEPDDGDDGGGGGDTVAADEWTNEVCGAFLELSEQLESAAGDDPELAAILEGEFEPGNVDELREGFALIETLFTELGGAIDDAAGSVQDAGIPDVDDGEAYRDQIVSAMEQAGGLIAAANTELADADVDSLASLEQLEATFTDFGAAFDALPDLDLGESGPPEIQAAFAEQPNCLEGEERFGSEG